MRWFIYNILFAIGYVLMFPKFLLRMWKRGGYARNMTQRLGCYSAEVRAKLSASRRIWVHAVSVGEANIAFRFMDEIRAFNPNAKFTFTTNTSTAYKIAEKKLHPDDVLLYFPMDFPSVIKKVVKQINPVALILLEGEIWPNLIRKLASDKVPVALVNGRVSQSSFKGYKMVKWFIEPVLKLFSVLLVQGDVDRQRLIDLGAPSDRVIVMGSAKYDLMGPGSETLAKTRSLLSMAGITEEHQILLGGSTWAGEEVALVETFNILKNEFPKLRLVLVPRHAERSKDIISELLQMGVKVLKRSELVSGFDKGEGDIPEILLVDSTGELMDFYAVADVVFVGKSLCAQGGQNFIEPAVFGKAIICGPNLQNFEQIAADFEKVEAMTKVADKKQLLTEVRRLLSNDVERRAMGARAALLVELKRGVVRRSVELVGEKLSQESEA